MDKVLPARANLDHLRGQAKKLLASFANGDAAAVRAFAENLPAARGVAPAKLRATKFKLSDAQSVIARQAGFASWSVLVRHVEQLRSLEGEWQIARLEIDGNEIGPAMLGGSRILIDGDRFRTESPSGNYEGIFTIDTEADPPRFDIHFVEGPEVGSDSLGIFRIDGVDELTLCLGLVNSERPKRFATAAGSGHALERLKRTSKARPEHVKGGTPPPAQPIVDVRRGDAAAFEVVLTPIYQAMQGEWSAVELVTGGKRMEESWLAYGKRTMTGNETKVVFGGQTMVHAKVRIDESTTPIAIDYLSLLPKTAGTVTYGIVEIVGDEVRFLMAPAGAPRPASFDVPGTLSRWRRA